LKELVDTFQLDHPLAITDGTEDASLENQEEKA
jgi:hypothetical protein